MRTTKGTTQKDILDDKKEMDEIADKFQTLNNKNEMADVIKELFDPKKIFMITDLSPDEIRLMTKIYALAEIKNIAIYKDSLQIFAELLLSNRRKSRTELLEAIKGYIGGQASLFSRMNPANWGRMR